MEETAVVIVGAGVVGLAVTAELARRLAPETVVMMERHDSFGRETSSRNSEVIHAGIYYPRGSLRARLCVTGNPRLYSFCRDAGVPCQRTGKLIVAPEEEDVAELETLQKRGRANGVTNLKLLDREALRRMEPHVKAAAALFSPSTGVVDTHRLMAALERRAAAAGALTLYRHEVCSAEPVSDGYRLAYCDPGGTRRLVFTRVVVNCAGLTADRMAAACGIDTREAGYVLHPCKGEYFRIPPAAAARLSHLIYPPPYADLRGLGIHVTRALDGSVRLGPNAFYVDTLDYTVDPAHGDEFFEGVRSFLPFLQRDDLQPDTSGIRPKLQAPGTPARDFIIQRETERGHPRLISLIGIESPGLTSCCSIAALVGDMATEALGHRPEERAC